MRRRNVVFLLLVLLLAAAATGCSKKESDVIKIGVFEPITGANAAGGQLEVEGIAGQQAVSRGVREKGGAGDCG